MSFTYEKRFCGKGIFFGEKLFDWVKKYFYHKTSASFNDKTLPIKKAFSGKYFFGSERAFWT